MVSAGGAWAVSSWRSWPRWFSQITGNTRCSLIATIVAGLHRRSGELDGPHSNCHVRSGSRRSRSSSRSRLAVGLVIARQGFAEQSTLETTRNFYGVLRVNRDGSMTDDNGEFHELIHGTHPARLPVSRRGQTQSGHQLLRPRQRRGPGDRSASPPPRRAPRIARCGSASSASAPARSPPTACRAT